MRATLTATGLLLLASAVLLATASRPVIPVARIAFAADPDPEDEVFAGKRPLPGLRLQLVPSQRSFALGAPIALTMRYTYSGDRPLAIETITYDRSGRIPNFGFRAVDEQGQAVRDPLPWTGGMMGGLRGAQRLAKDAPYEQEVVLNEWLGFDRPGRYTVTASSGIVHLDESGELGRGPVIPLESEPLEITITPPDDRDRRERLDRDRADLEGKDQEARERAMRDLRFMIDPRAIPLLVRGLATLGENTTAEAAFGVLSFRDLAPVKAELLRMLDAEPWRITPYRIEIYSNLLAEADLRARGVRARPPDAAFVAAERPWNERLSAKFKERLATLPPREAAAATIEGMAFGPILSRSDAKNWRLIFDNAEGLDKGSQYRAAHLVQSDCRDRELIPELRKVALNARLEPPLRSAAIVALHLMGDDPARDLLVADLTAPAPIFSDEAHETVSDDQARAITRKLIALVETGPATVRDSAAKRLRDFGSADASELADLLRRDAIRKDRPVRTTLLAALAIRSPADAVPFLRDVFQEPRQPRYDGLRDAAYSLACGIDTPAARRLVLDQLRSGSEDDRADQADALWRAGLSAGDAGPRPGLGEVGHFTQRSSRVDPAVIGSFVPELLALARADPSERVRAVAGMALAGITGIPEQGGPQPTQAQRERLISRWEDWWREHGDRFRR